MKSIAGPRKSRKSRKHSKRDKPAKPPASGEVVFRDNEPEEIDDPEEIDE